MYISCDRENYKGDNRNMAIIVDGIIGAGKTTVGELISQHYKLPFFEEIKSDDSIGLIQRMLDRFYEDPCRWSAIIQTMFLNDRFKDMKRVQELNKQGIFDRSIYGDEIFAKTIHHRGQMTDDEYLIYQEVLSNMLAYIDVPELLIYLDVSVDTALKRIRKRSRSTEAELIPRDYMEDLKTHYDEWFEAYNLSPKVKIDFNDDLYLNENLSVSDLGKEIVEHVRKYVK
jgi:deoxyadenosine/deoxycytidine kinase